MFYVTNYMTPDGYVVASGHHIFPKLTSRQEVFWRALPTPGFEHCTLQPTDTGLVSDGIILRQHKGESLRIFYRIEFDQDWRPRRVEVSRSGPKARKLSLTADGEGHWQDESGQRLSEFNGCFDMDLMGTPLTNTPAVRRLQQKGDATAELPVVFIHIPDLELSRVKQRYTRLDEVSESYRYESNGFSAVLEFDRDGLVRNYEGQWRRMDAEHLEATLADVLPSQKPSPELGKHADIYDWLVGSWKIDVRDFDGEETRTNEGEVVFGWVLEGRAMQDVWIVPPRDKRRARTQKIGNRYGTTLRVYDAVLDAWRITWINPVTGAHNELVGRKVGDDIVQEGSSPNGELERWCFREITTNSFHWTGESSSDNGKTWRLNTEFFARL